MALLTTHSDKNKIVMNTKGEWDEKELVFGYWQQLSYVGGAIVRTWDRMDKHTKRKVESFEYVGMTKKAAQTCANEMVTQYKKDIYAWEWDELNGKWRHKSGGFQNMADVRCEWVAGDMWKVVVQVNQVFEAMTVHGGTPVWPSSASS